MASYSLPRDRNARAASSPRSPGRGRTLGDFRQVYRQLPHLAPGSSSTPPPATPVSAPPHARGNLAKHRLLLPFVDWAESTDSAGPRYEPEAGQTDRPTGSPTAGYPFRPETRLAAPRPATGLADRTGRDSSLTLVGEEKAIDDLTADEFVDRDMTPALQRLGFSYKKTNLEAKANTPVPPTLGVSWNNGRHVVKPYYRVRDKEAQLQFVRERMARLNLHNGTALQSPAAAPGQPIHVFVDISNIVISFNDHIRLSRRIPPSAQIEQPPFFFEALATILERGRPCAKRVIVGSMGPGRAWAPHLIDAAARGYTVHVLQRVQGAKPPLVTAATAAAAAAAPAASPAPTPTPASKTRPLHHHEQAVDEILQLHMLLSVVDTQAPLSAGGEFLAPGTMVLASGDGAATAFADGFFAQALRALKYGWHVEVVGFSRSMSRLWAADRVPAPWRGRFHRIELDPFAEDLLKSFH